MRSRKPTRTHPDLRIDVTWDDEHKRWRLEAVRYDGAGHRVTVRATSDSRAAIDRECAQALLRLVTTELDARLF